MTVERPGQRAGSPLPGFAPDDSRSFRAVLREILLKSVKPLPRPARRGEELFRGLHDAALLRAASIRVPE